MEWNGTTLGPFILGTAQLGMEYGVANRLGKPSAQAAVEIVSSALDSGVTTFDTAQAYGESEHTLGTILQDKNWSHRANVITKIGEDSLRSIDDCLEAIRKSLQRLRCSQLFGLLAHSAQSLDGLARQATISCFKAAKENGLVRHTGVSVYAARDALNVLALDDVEIVQMPLNVLDRSALDCGVIDYAQRHDKLLNFRSAYLQGFLTMDPAQLPDYMQFAQTQLKEWRQLCADEQTPPAEAALYCATYLSAGYPLVIGSETATQVAANAFHLSRPDALLRGKAICERSAALSASCPDRLLNPALWRTLSTPPHPAS